MTRAARVRLLAGATRDRLRESVRNARLERRAHEAQVIPPPEAFARFGAGSMIVPPGRVGRAEWIEIGVGALVHELSWLEVDQLHDGTTPRLVVGDGARIGRFAHIACLGEVVIGDHVLTGDNLYVADTYHSYEAVGVPIMHQPMAPSQPVRIERGAFLAHGVRVLPGVTIGENAVVGAGSVVMSDIPPRSVAVGNPARVVRRWDEGGNEWVRVASGESVP